MEVGLAGSTRSAGKPRTWGRGGAGRDWVRETFPVHAEEEKDVNTTGPDSEESKDESEAAFHLAGPSAHAGVSHGDLAEDEPARRKRSGRGDNEEFESDWENEFKKSAHGLKQGPTGRHRSGG